MNTVRGARRLLLNNTRVGGAYLVLMFLLLFGGLYVAAFNLALGLTAVVVAVLLAIAGIAILVLGAKDFQRLGVD